MQLGHYIRLVLRWSWLTVLCALICGGATYVVSKKLTPVYEASALIEVNDPANPGNSGVFNNQAAAVADALEVTSTDVLQAASRALAGVSVDELQTAVSASPLDNTQLIEVRADAPRAQEAAAMANTVARVFIQQQVAQALAIEQRAAAQLSEGLVTAQAAVDTAQAQLTTLENANAPQDQIAHQRDILNSYQSNYDALFASYSQIQLQESLIATSFTLVQSAVPPVKPKSPNTLLNTMLGAALGLLLAVAVVLLYDWFDSTIKAPEDVARLGLLEPLGSVPLRRRSWRETLAIDSAIEQAFVAISTSFKAVSAGRRAVLMTGLRSGAGVSLAATRLAVALAESGSRVLLVDANLSRPVQHVMFNVPNTRGLSNEPDISLSQPTLPRGWLTQWATSVPNLHLLPAGPQPDHAEPIRLISRLRDLTESLLQPSVSSPLVSLSSDEIDILIFDAPTLDQGPDAIALAPVTDCTVLVIEAGKERPEALHRVEATLQRLGSPIMGVIVNRQQAKRQAYFYAQQPQQFTDLAEHLYAGTQPKYPSLRARAISPQRLPEMSISAPLVRASPLSDIAQRAAVPVVATIPDTPDTRASTRPPATPEHVDDLSGLNGFRPGRDQSGEAR